MDPNEALRRLRDLLSLRNPSEEALDEVRELFQGLDEWLSRGGFLPKPWQRQWRPGDYGGTPSTF